MSITAIVEPGPATAGKLSNRYADAYRVAEALVKLGMAIKIIGYIIAGGLVLVAINKSNGIAGFNGDLFIGEVVGALIPGAILYFMGVQVSAQGQVLRASLDCAVNTSPLLTNSDRIGIMGL